MFPTIHQLPIAIFWLAVTLAIYGASRIVHRRYQAWWSSPLLLTWGLLLVLVPLFHATYADYMTGTAWLMAFLGPTTVAFALPIFDQRDMIRRHWPVLIIGVVVGSAVSISLSWVLATLLHFSPVLKASLLPRSITTPFAMVASHELGGIPGLTASFTAITGLFGAAVGSPILKWISIRSRFGTSMPFGVGAHGAGVARSYQLGMPEGSIASTAMVLSGLLNVLGSIAIASIFGTVA